jgi:hypothetical protein
MPGVPPTSPRLAIPRYSGADAADFPTQVNAVTDAIDLVAARSDDVRFPAGADIATADLADGAVTAAKAAAALLNLLAPVGEIALIPSRVATGAIRMPDGWQQANGSQFSAARFPTLAAWVGNVFGASTNGFGAAGTTHRLLPTLADPVTDVHYMINLGVVAPASALLTDYPNNGTALDFGNNSIAPIGSGGVTRSVTVRSDGSKPLVGGAVTLTGTDAAQFTITGNTLGVAARNPGELTSITVRFRATSLGAKTAQLRIASDDPASPYLVNLVGTGTA